MTASDTDPLNRLKKIIWGSPRCRMDAGRQPG